ncbi:MAG: Ureidoglycolate hydrolase [Pseudanabaenaceae cyanobacterium SKYGB_i_bin29]|nr:Ureidoglycolate hydrolase [Pseudanabaenaceae cyanobacterium SKYG29]MDW8421204.1 Ureidoglycolate hydrolase [Pseudanabaenaceae cyanobacterium SKYGB_i_bin29]
MSSILEKSCAPIDPEVFRPFGQVIYPTIDGKIWDAEEAQLDLSQGVPRVYLMQLSDQGLVFDRITQHRRVTQCLASVAGQEWFLGVASPTIPAAKLSVADIHLFRIVGVCLVKLEVGTWHAGPFFRQPEMVFFNLELQDTNINDHHSVQLGQPIRFRIE